MSDLDIGSQVCYKTNQFIAFNKPAGIAVQSKAGTDFQQMVNAYARRSLFLVHRIDQPVSGLVLFARNERAAASLSQQFAGGLVNRIYHAVVSSLPDPPEGELIHYLRHNPRTNKSIVVPETGTGAKECRLNYRYLASSDTYHLLEVELHTGRPHQIRAQLAAAGFPVKGDVKYGARRANKDRSIHLHATRLIILHPVSGEEIRLEAPFPDEVLWNYFRAKISGI
jgi:23S rRNA pseudouridine1911/1915/1917 synthase